MIKFIDWWFRETCRLPHGFIVLLGYLIFVRSAVMYFVSDIDYMMMDGVVFAMITTITMAGPQMKEQMLADEKARERGRSLSKHF